MALEHARYLYNLQGGDETTDESEESDEWDSEDSGSSAGNNKRWRNNSRRSVSASRVNGNGRHSSQPPHSSRGGTEKRRMSLLTGQYYDVPSYDEDYAHYDSCGAANERNGNMKRRFFLSGPGVAGGWEDDGGVDTSVKMRTKIVNGFMMNGYAQHDLVPLMERSGQRDVDAEDAEDDDYEEMSVD